LVSSISDKRGIVVSFLFCYFLDHQGEAPNPCRGFRVGSQKLIDGFSSSNLSERETGQKLSRFLLPLLPCPACNFALADVSDSKFGPIMSGGQSDGTSINK
jgi:hypothetical protein